MPVLHVSWPYSSLVAATSPVSHVSRPLPPPLADSDAPYGRSWPTKRLSCGRLSDLIVAYLRLSSAGAFRGAQEREVAWKG